MRAAAAFAVSEVCAAKKVQYQRAAAKICEVPKQIITMDVKAEELRRELDLEPEELPANSVSAMYQLHCGMEIARKVAANDPAEIANLQKKIEAITVAILDDTLSVRKVAAQFAEERKKLATLRRGIRPVPEVAKANMLPPAVERLDAEALRGKVDALHVPSGIAVPVLTITPPDTTAQGIDAYFADAKMREAISSAVPVRGGMWIYIDLNASEKVAVTVPADAPEVGDQVPTAPPAVAMVKLHKKKNKAA
ncbi:MAG TPA: hypothetical protein VKX17_16365 [Planctomycetota bacterium]|nr:hypothetical protein [Planctomycetota bacterium]